MSNTELVAELDLKMIKTDENRIAETIGIDNRSLEILLVLNEVFDSTYPSSKS